MHKRIPIGLGIVLLCISMWLLITPNTFVNGLINQLDALGYDLQLRMQVSTQQQAIKSPIAIIDVDEKSLKEEGRWPWDRSKLATLFDKLHQLGAAVIAVDVIFPEQQKNLIDFVYEELRKTNQLTPSVASVLTSNKDIFDEDRIFSNKIKLIQPVLSLGFTSNKEKTNTLSAPILKLNSMQSEQLDLIRASGYIGNTPVLQSAAKYSGFINVFPDSDGIIRRAPLIIEYDQGIYPSLSLQAVMLFLDKDISLIEQQYNNKKKLEGIQVDRHVIPTDASGRALIPFIGKSYTFPYYSATDVLHNRIPDKAISGRIVFIGTSALGLGDLVSTAIQSPYPGVEIHASLANGILQDIFSSTPEWTRGAELSLTLFFGLIAAFLFPYLGPRILGIIIIISLPVFLYINNYIWHQTGLVISILMPALLVLVQAILNILYGYLFETRRREHLKRMFGQYVPPKHIDEMLEGSGDYALEGESRELSVLFADIRNFTAISENLTANELVRMLNTLLTPMTEIIFKHQGTIDKYVGDLIMAFWGAPLKDKSHAQHAMASALEMQKKLKKLREMSRTKNEAEIHMGIGINTGIMNVGDMGSQYRRNYTVLGDAVNLASRVESLTKFYGVEIIVTENTQINQTQFAFRKLDQVRVKGKKHGVVIYELLCLKAELSPEMNGELQSYHKALDYYFQQQWDDAFELMSRLHREHPDTIIYKIYIDRIEILKDKPLQQDWDGIYVHSTK